LLETGKFISQKEKEKEKGTGDDELIIYNGLFPSMKIIYFDINFPLNNFE